MDACKAARVCHDGALVKTGSNSYVLNIFCCLHMKGEVDTNLTDMFLTASLQLFPAHHKSSETPRCLHTNSANVMCFLGFVKGILYIP